MVGRYSNMRAIDKANECTKRKIEQKCTLESTRFLEC